MKRIEFAEGLRIPLDAVTQPWAILARRGWGKSYTATKLAEGMLGAGAQVIILDPVGTWWGLRLAADGKSPGFPIPVFGGHQGDVEVDPGDGARLAALLVERRLSAVIDVSQMRKKGAQEFATVFGEELFQLKKMPEHRGPVHVMVEEAQRFIPQRVSRGGERMLGAFEDICRLGRNFGMGFCVISQRPQSVNKEVLNQAEVLVVGQVSGPHERKAIEAWVLHQGIDVAEMFRELPSLPIGEGFLWSPQWLRLLRRVKIRKKRTFDSSSTPAFSSSSVRPGNLTKVDVGELRDALGSAKQAAEANRPAALRRRIADLEAELRAAGKAEEVRVEVPVLTDEHLKNLRTAERRIEEAAKQISDIAEGAVGQLVEVGRAISQAASAARPPTSPAPPRRPARKMPARQVGGLTRSTKRVGADGITGPMQRILDALAWFESIGVEMPPNTAVAFVAGYRPYGGAYANPRGALRTGGFIEYPQPGRLQLTDEGRSVASDPGAPGSVEEMHSRVMEKLSGPEQRILQPLLDCYPDDLSNDRLAELSGYSKGGGAYANPRGRLRTLGLIDYPSPGRVVASDLMFLGG